MGPSSADGELRDIDGDGVGPTIVGHDWEPAVTDLITQAPARVSTPTATSEPSATGQIPAEPTVPLSTASALARSGPQRRGSGTMGGSPSDDEPGSSDPSDWNSCEDSMEGACISERGERTDEELYFIVGNKFQDNAAGSWVQMDQELLSAENTWTRFLKAALMRRYGERPDQAMAEWRVYQRMMYPGKTFAEFAAGLRDLTGQNHVSERSLLAQFYRKLDKKTRMLVEQDPVPTTLGQAVDKATASTIPSTTWPRVCKRVMVPTGKTNGGTVLPHEKRGMVLTGGAEAKSGNLYTGPTKGLEFAVVSSFMFYLDVVRATYLNSSSKLLVEAEISAKVWRQIDGPIDLARTCQAALDELAQLQREAGWERLHDNGDERAKVRLTQRSSESTETGSTSGAMQFGALAEDGVPAALTDVEGERLPVKPDSGARYLLAGTDWLMRGERVKRRALVDLVKGIGGFVLKVVGGWAFGMRNAFGHMVTMDVCIIEGCSDKVFVGVDFLQRYKAVMDFEKNEERHDEGLAQVVIPFRTDGGDNSAKAFACLPSLWRSSGTIGSLVLCPMFPLVQPYRGPAAESDDGLYPTTQWDGRTDGSDSDASSQDVYHRFKEGYARKLAHLWHGPSCVAEMVDRHAAELAIAGTDYRIFSTPHVSKLKLVKQFPGRPSVEVVAPECNRVDFDEVFLPEDSWEQDVTDDEYEVERIVDVRTSRRTRYDRNRRDQPGTMTEPPSVVRQAVEEFQAIGPFKLVPPRPKATSFIFKWGVRAKYAENGKEVFAWACLADEACRTSGKNLFKLYAGKTTMAVKHLQKIHNVGSPKTETAIVKKRKHDHDYSHLSSSVLYSNNPTRLSVLMTTLMISNHNLAFRMVEYEEARLMQALLYKDEMKTTITTKQVKEAIVELYTSTCKEITNFLLENREDYPNFTIVADFWT
ncbi:unnamed protein product [Phytophthora fragariaefolia]|uniref:Unnamed protein product n=1 Tax=Phytophthora fragariaefolia TaxID=1490495 RepID=A0A9W6XL48_9STRA|nr:unnamed protein product [Phytophthora fragariaefolia]